MAHACSTTTHIIKKELSICQSLMCLDLVSFPVLSQIKPQAPILVEQYKPAFTLIRVCSDYILSPVPPEGLVSWTCSCGAAAPIYPSGPLPTFI